MTPAPEKAAPIPDDVVLIAGVIVNRVSHTLSVEQCDKLFSDITRALAADRASQEERIREDEREALDLIRGYRQEVNAHHFAMRKALEHVRSHFPGAAAEFDAVYELELRVRLRGDAS